MKTEIGNYTPIIFMVNEKYFVFKKYQKVLYIFKFYNIFLNNSHLMFSQLNLTYLIYVNFVYIFV